MNVRLTSLCTQERDFAAVQRTCGGNALKPAASVTPKRVWNFEHTLALKSQTKDFPVTTRRWQSWKQ